MKLKITIALTLLFIISLSLFFILPEWILSANIADLKNWYPNFGSMFFIGVRTILPLNIIILLSIIFLWRKEILSINFKKYKLVSFYTLTLIFLIVQYFYNYNNEEVYPAVMMPAFTSGKYNYPIYDFDNEIIITNCSGKIDTTNLYELTLNIIGDEESKLIASKKITNLNPSAELKEYIYQLSKTVLNENCINKIVLNKITNEYLYDEKKFSLKNTERTNLYEITYYAIK